MWRAHMDRLRSGCERLRIPVPDETELQEDLGRLASPQDGNGVFRLQVTAGEGGRAYGRPAPCRPNRVSSWRPLPAYPKRYWQEGVRLHLCRLRLGRQPLLAGIKHCNRLEYVLARSEWQDADIPEGLLCDSEGHVIEGVVSNTFAVAGGELLTPQLEECGVAGVMQARVRKIAEHAGLVVRQERFPLETWLEADEVFMTNSLIGIWPVTAIGHKRLSQGPVTRRLRGSLLEYQLGMEDLADGARPREGGS